MDQASGIATDLIERLRALPDPASRRRLLDERAALLDDSCAEALKAEADRALRSDIGDSMVAADLLLHLADLTRNPLHRALGLLAQANAHAIGLGEYSRGVELYDEAAAIYRVHGCLGEEARSQVGKVWALASLSRYDEALAIGAAAGALLERHEQWQPLATLTMNLAAVYGRLGQDNMALATLDRATEIYGRLGTEGALYLPWVDHNRAIVLRNLGDFAASIAASTRACQGLEAQGQTVEAARGRQSLAITYFMLGRYNESLALLDRVRAVFLADGRRRDAVLAGLFVSDCLLQLRRFGDVLEQCREVRSLFSELGTRFEVAQAILNEAVAYAGLRRYDEAQASLAAARQVFVTEGNTAWTAAADLELAAILQLQGRLQACLDLALACAVRMSEQGLAVKAAQARLLGARAAAALGQADLARELAGEALRVAEDRDLPSLKYQGHHLLAAIHRSRADLQAAWEEFELAIAQLERLRGHLMVEYRADFLEDKAALYADAVDLCLELGRPQQALDYAERAKSRALVDLLAYRLDLGVGARRPADQPLVDELARLRAERDRLYRRWEEGWDAADEARRQVQSEVLALERRITDLWHRLLVHNADYAADAALWQVRTEPIQPYLPDGTLLIEYFAIGGSLLAFLVSASSVEVRRLPGGMAGVQQLLQLLWLNLGAVPGSAPARVAALAANARSLLQRLHAALLAPLADTLALYPRLIIVPHGPLHYLPFHALHDGRAYLVAQHEIAYLPSASLLRFCRAVQPAADGLLALGHSHGGRLPFAVQEAQAVADLTGGQVYIEEDASPVRLRNEGRSYRVLHLAAHGDFRTDNPLFSGLALAGGSLTTLDVFNLRLQASLVTLSACQTGRSVVGGGDELLGLLRAFLYAGAASLVLSQWLVDDRSAADLMTDFYRQLLAGKSKSAALQQAQLSFLAGGDPARSHPYFWAPFFLAGDMGPL